MADIFISYARTDKEFVHKLHDAFITAGRDVWVDWEDIPPSVEWLAEIKAAIEGADTVLSVVSPASIGSETCSMELEHAALHHKRMIPVVIEDVSPDTVPQLVGKLQWLSFRKQDDFDEAFLKLAEAIDTDVSWVRMHTRLLTRALEWQTRDRDSSLLLRGNDLKSAEAWLLEAANKEPTPTESQHQYIASSRNEASARMRRLIVSLVVGILITISLAVVALFQRQEAVTQRDVAEQQRMHTLGKQLAAQSEVIRTQSPRLLDRSTLLAIEASRRASGLEIDRALRQAVGLLPRLLFEYNLTEPIQTVALSQDGEWAAAGGSDGFTYIWELAHGTEIIRIEHGEPVLAVAFSHDGMHLASASKIGVILRSMESGKQVLLKANDVKVLAFSANLLAAAGAKDGRIVLWDVGTRKKVRSFQSGDKVTALSFSTDGRLLAAGGDDNTVRVWDIKTGKRLMLGKHNPASASMPLRLGSKDGGVFTVAFDQSGKYVVSGAQDRTVSLWESSGGRELFRGYQSDSVYSAAISQDTRWLASGGMDETARVWSLQDGSERYRLEHQYVVQKVIWTVNGDLLTVSGDGTARVWSMATGRELSRMYHTGYIYDAAISADGRRVITGDWEDGTVRVWELSEGGAVVRVAHDDTRDARYSSDARHLITRGENNFAQLWELPDGKPTYRFQHDPFVSHASFSPDGKMVVTAGWDGLVHLWDVASGKKLATMTHEGRVTDARFSSDGSILVTAGFEDAVAGIWSVPSGKELFRLKHEGVVQHLRRAFPRGGVRSINIDPDGKTLATGGQDGTVRFWDLKDGREILRLPHNGYVLDTFFVPDKQYFVTDSENEIYVWSMPEGKEVARIDKQALNDPFMSVLGLSPNGRLMLVGSFEENSVQVRSIPNLEIIAKLLHEDDVFSAEFNKDGSRVLTGSRDKTARIWDTSTWQELTRITANDFIYSAYFSPDEAFFVTACGDGIARIWSTDVASMGKIACQRLRRNLTQEEWRQYFGTEKYVQTCKDQEAH